MIFIMLILVVSLCGCKTKKKSYSDSEDSEEYIVRDRMEIAKKTIDLVYNIY